MCAVTLKTAGDFSNKQDWNRQFEWFRNHVEKYQQYFKPIIKNL